MTRIVAIAAMAAWLVPGSAFALDVAGVHVDDKASVGGEPLVLNGAGVRKRAIFSVYVGSLYLPEKATSAQAALAKAPRRIQLNLLGTLSSDLLVSALVDGIKENTTAAQMQSIAVQTGELAAIMKSFGQAKEGSIVTLDFVDGATKIGLNGAPQGSIDGEPFNRALTRIWIGEHPVQEDLRKAMLGSP
jgi:long-chain acyl-CoA synthetase